MYNKGQGLTTSLEDKDLLFIIEDAELLGVSIDDYLQMFSITQLDYKLPLSCRFSKLISLVELG